MTLPVLDATAAQLDEYFAGTRTAFDLPLDLHGTAFQLAAWQALAEIPYGETRTYAEQADAHRPARRPCGRSARRTAATRSRSSSPATGSIGSDGALARVRAAGSRSRRRCSSSSGKR